jgi:hypothetical protein
MTLTMKHEVVLLLLFLTILGSSSIMAHKNYKESNEIQGETARLAALENRINKLENQIVTGKTLPEQWVNYDNYGWYVDIKFPNPRNEVPEVTTTIHGNSDHWASLGSTSIYSLTKNGFRIYIKQHSGHANTLGAYKWAIHWMAIYS